MPRFYHVDLAQYVAGSDARWIDNLVSRFAIPGVEGSSRGSSRRLTATAIQHIALIRSLTEDLKLPAAAAVSLAGSLLSTAEETEIPAGRWLGFAFRRAEFLRHVDTLIADGVESITPARRGRPPISPSTRVEW